MFTNTHQVKLNLMMGIFVFGIFLCPQKLWAASKVKNVKEGNQLFKEGNYESAANKYKEALNADQESDVINFNLGTALYKNGKYQDTIDHLQKSLLTQDKQLQEKSYYNL